MTDAYKVVYAAFFGAYSDRTLVGIFSTRQRAHDALVAYAMRYLRHCGDEDEDKGEALQHYVSDMQIEVVDLDRVDALGWGESWQRVPFDATLKVEERTR